MKANDFLNKQIIGELSFNINKDYFALNELERSELENLRIKYGKRFSPRPNCCAGYSQTYLFFDYLQRAKKRIEKQECK